MAKVVYSSNPLNPKTNLSHIFYGNEVSISQVSKDLEIRTDCVVIINGKYDEQLSSNQILKKEDFVYIQSVAQGDDALKVVADVVQVAALIGASYITGGAAAPFLKAAILVGGSLVATGIRSQISERSLEAAKGTSLQESPTYSLSAAGNAVRVYENLPLVCGRHRMFPDFASNPYEEIFTNDTLDIEKVERLPIEENNLSPLDVTPYGTTWQELSSIGVLQPTNVILNFTGGPNTECQYPFDLYLDPEFSTSVNFYNSTGSLSNFDNVVLSPFGAGGFNPYSLRVIIPGAGGLDAYRNAIVYIDDPASPNNGQYFYYSDLKQAVDRVFDTLTVGSTCPDYTTIDLTTVLDVNGDPIATSLNPIDLDPPYVDPDQFSTFGALKVNDNCRDVLTTRSQANARQQLNHHFSYGFGDLEIYDRRFGQTNLIDLRDIKVTRNEENTTNWKMPLAHGTTEPLQIDTVSSYTDEGVVLGTNIEDRIFTNVDAVGGAQLINDENFEFPTNWIVRQGPPDTVQIEVGISGRLFSLNPASGYDDLTVTIDCQYRLWDTGPGGWVNFTGFPLTLINGDTVPINTEFEQIVPSNQYDVRMRIVGATPPVDNNDVIELNWRGVKFIQEDDATYCGVNQEFVSVRSSEQLSGNLDRYSAIVEAKCFDFDGASNQFVWRHTRNPASWFLYFARGGFKNETSDGTGVFPDSPTVGWQNNPGNVNNAYRLFGYGTPDDEIDYDCLYRWHQFCEANNLFFSAVMDKKQTVLEWLSIIANVGRASVQWSNCLLGVTYEDPNQPVVGFFTPDNIVAGSFKVNYINTTELPDEVQLNYVERREDPSTEYPGGQVEWTQDSVYARRSDLVGEPVRRITVDLLGCTDRDQAQREANLLINKQLYQRRTVLFETDGDGLQLVRGSIIVCTHDLTCWGDSAAACGFETNGSEVTRIDIGCNICLDTATIMVRNPFGEMSTYEVAVDGNYLILPPGNGWGLIDLPNVLETVNFTENQFSQYTDTQPADWLIMANPVATPMKRLRVTGIDYPSKQRAVIQCVDDEPEYYAREFDPDTYVAPPNYNVICIEANNLKAINKGDGKVALSFDLINTPYASLSYMIGSTGPFSASYDRQTIFGDTEYCLDFPQGQKITLTVTPVVIGTPYSVKSATIEFEVD